MTDKLVEALKDSAQGWSNVVEFGLLPRQHHENARRLADKCIKAVEALASRPDTGAGKSVVVPFFPDDHPPAAVAGEGEEDRLLADANSWYSENQIDEIARIISAGNHGDPWWWNTAFDDGEDKIAARLRDDDLSVASDVLAALSQPAADAVGTGEDWHHFEKHPGLQPCGRCHATLRRTPDMPASTWRCFRCNPLRELSTPPRQPAGDGLREALRMAQEVRDLLLERIQGSPARSAAHNARVRADSLIMLLSSMTPALASTKSPDADGGEA